MKDSSIATISLEKTINAVILASGRGSNAKALLDYCHSSENLNSNFKWQVNLIVSDNRDAGVLNIANDYNIPTLIVPYPKGGKGNREIRRQNYSRELSQQITDLCPDISFAICAGFMKILTKEFLSVFEDKTLPIYRVINIHPSLLPSFPGANAYKDAYEYGVTISGATTHFVDEKVDHGPIIDQVCFERDCDDSLDQFKGKGLKLEHPLFVNTLKLIQNNKLRFLKQSDSERLIIKVLKDKK